MKTAYLVLILAIMVLSVTSRSTYKHPQLKLPEKVSDHGRPVHYSHQHLRGRDKLMPKNAAATGKADEPNYLDYQENDDDITDGSASGITDGSASGISDGSASGITDDYASDSTDGSASGITDGSASGIADDYDSDSTDGSASGIMA
ncbi:caM kinase-like vesicle-associated protein [Pocillopora damicornis]|uniref:caM kinase-like vesicle-associated protein n=1 Tax=Pocillopora damicornis TaxID=46731 RepID=UPI000F559A05|nr:caM kinase-like vesicle-associated protein [Pocillopora damicornis]